MLPASIFPSRRPGRTLGRRILCALLKTMPCPPRSGNMGGLAPRLHPCGPGCFNDVTRFKDAGGSGVTDDLTWRPATALLDMYRRKDASPVEVIRAVLARLSRLNPKLNALNLVDEATALASAEASTARWAKGA